MSFTTEVKDELTRLELNKNEKRAEIAALIKHISTINLSSDGLSLTFRTKNAGTIKNVSLILQELYGVRPGLAAIKEEKLNKQNIYVIKVNDHVREILEDVDLFTDKGLQNHPRMKFFKNDNMIRAYIMGAFLASGSVNSPNSTNYHLEIAVSDEEYGNFLIKLLSRYNINAKISSRRNHFIVYIKSSEKIADFLRVIGANNAIFTFEDVRIQRDFMNNLSRLNNCEIANETKSLETANRQYESVIYLIENGYLEKLSAKDQEMALLRYENPEATLMELSELYSLRTGTVLSKSGIRHRFEKITSLAEKYQKEKN